MSETKPADAVIVRPSMNPLQGTLEERIKAFDQIAANLASLQLNGWDQVPKVKAGCWLADGAGMHPAIFMQNHYCMNIKGRLIIEPKWEFIVGTLQARVPGFKFSVDEETDSGATVTMEGPNGSHTVTYTTDDARRQGLFNREGNAWTGGNTREMCLKQAIKRCGRRVGAGALMDMPIGFDGLELEQQEHAEAEAVTSDSTAEVIDQALEDVPEEPKVNPVKALSEALIERCGKTTKAEALQKASELYNEMYRERTGTSLRAQFRRADEIGPVDADDMIAYLKAHPDFLKPSKAKPGTTNAQRAAQKDDSGVETAYDEPEEEDPGPEPETPPSTKQDAYTSLMMTVERARKVLAPRQFVTEFPKGSNKFWLQDQATFSKAGYKKSVKLMESGEVCVDVRRLNQLSAILAELCDEQERAGR